MSSSDYSYENCNPISRDDACTSFVSFGHDYSTVLGQNQALSAPLGSQLTLLNAAAAGNPYFGTNAFVRTSNPNTASQQSMQAYGYNSLTGNKPMQPQMQNGNVNNNNSNGSSFFSFSRAYGM